MKEEVKKIDPVEVMIASQLSQFEVKEEDLKAKVEEYSLLVITGVDDKAGRKAVSEARKHLKSIRNDIERKGKGLRENFTKVSKAIIGREKDFVSIISPGEERLEQMESDIAEEEEELRQQKEYEEQQRIISRTKELERYGATFNGVQYQLGEHVLTMAEVRLFTDVEFNRAATFFKEDYENFEQLKLQAEIENRNAKMNRKESAIQYLNCLGYVETSQGYLDQEILHLAGKFDLEFDSLDELDAFKVGISMSRDRHIKEKGEAETKRIADQALKAQQAKLAEIQKAQDLKQAELDRKQKELDDQLAAVKAQKEADEKRAKQLEYEAKVNLFESRRTQLNNTPNLLSKIDVDNMHCSMYTLSDTLWEGFLLDCKAEFETRQKELAKEAEDKAAAEELRRQELTPDIEVLKQIAVDIKGSIQKHKMKTSEGEKMMNSINELKGKIATYIEEQIKTL